MKQLIETPAGRPGVIPYRITDRRPRAEAPHPRIGVGKAGARLLSLLVCSLLLLPTGAFAQEFRATISGRVVDPSGAVVPGADIVVREMNTGTVNRTTSNNAGQYVAPFLLPRNYSITVTKTGFQTLVRGGIVLQAQEHPILNLVLTVGSASQTVTVTAQAPLLNMVNASVGDVISTKSVEDLPLNGRTAVTLAELSVGALLTGAPGETTEFDNATMNSLSIAGAAGDASEVTLDGAPDVQLTGGQSGGVAFSPTQDTVQEVSVQTFSTDASIGHTLAGAINQVTKGGTNQFHGTLYDFTLPTNMTANLYFNGRTVPVTPTPVSHYNQYGLTVGGPVLIPKVFSGRNKLFFFFAWERFRILTPTTTLTTVPTDAEREGDFSALLAGGSSYQLYEPNTGTLVNGSFTRKPVPNNCLTNQSSYCSTVANAGITIDPIAAAYMKFYPEPNYTSGVSPVTNQDNYISNAPSGEPFSSEFGRMDYNLNARNHMFCDFRHNVGSQAKENYFNNNSTGSILIRENWGSTLDDVITMNPTTVFDLRFDWTYYNNKHKNPASMYSPTSVGFPSYMETASNFPELPEISFSNYQSFSNTEATLDPSTIYQAFGDVVKSLGRHTLKIGFDGRQYRQWILDYDNASGDFSPGTSFVTCGTGCSAQPFGGDLASFEYGLPSSGSFGINEAGDYRSYYVASFVQDDWRVSDHLTLNLGLRFDIDTPWGEKFGRTESGFSPTAVNSASAAAATAFVPATATSGNTTVSVSSINTLGGLTFPNPVWGAPYQIQNKTGFWSPRFGFSYNPARFSKTILRGGFGVFVAPQSLKGKGYSAGFSATTSYTATTDGGFTTASTLDDPFPTGFAQPAGASQGASTFLGSSISFFSPVQHDQYSERWTLGVQQALTKSTLLEVIYEGNHGVHLPVSSQNLNAAPMQYLTRNPYRDQNLSTALGLLVAHNPFQGLLPLNGNLNTATTISVGTLAVPYPEYSSVTEEQLTNGQSLFNSGMIHLEQRARLGLTLTANYSYSKMIEQDTYLNPQDTTLFRGISPNEDFKHHFTVGGVYELPFGRGKLFSFSGGRLANALAGGWTLNGIYQFQTGLPIGLSDIPFQPGETMKDIKVRPRDTSTTNPALVNASSVFVTGSQTKCTISAGQPCDGTVFFNGQYTNHYRTLPATLGSVRQDGFNNLDASILKNFTFAEKTYLQLRFETFNTFNHPTFSAPNVSSATKSNFGYITGQSNTPRTVQLGARFVF